jgi:hypothetical protein
MRRFWGVLSPICGRYQLNADFFNRLGCSRQFEYEILHIGGPMGPESACTGPRCPTGAHYMLWVRMDMQLLAQSVVTAVSNYAEHSTAPV